MFFKTIIVLVSAVLCIAGAVLIRVAAGAEIGTLRSRSAKTRKRQLSALDEYRFPATVREVFRRENPRRTEPQGELAFEGLKQYFALTLLEREAGRRGPLGMPSVLVDEAWHSFVLCTEAYEKFCDKFFGQMAHHCPDPKARPGRLTGDTEFKDDVLNTWSAFGRGRDAYPEHFTTMNNVPLLFALDSHASPSNGWVWTEPARSALARQENERKSDSKSNSESTGSSCACFFPGSLGTSSSSSSSSSKHSVGTGGANCSTKSSGNSCSSSSSSGGGSCCCCCCCCGD